MPDSIERCLETALSGPAFLFGQIHARKANGGFLLCHRDDDISGDLQIFRDPNDATKIARYDDDGNYRPLKTAPNLRHGWRLEVQDRSALTRALNCFYPGRLAVFSAWMRHRLSVTPLRQTLNRQSGMYRVAAGISDEQIDEVVGNFCRSSCGCLRTILWRRDENGTIASTKLAPKKFDAAFDQASVTGGPRSAIPKALASEVVATAIPLFCQEACNLLVAECRKVVKGENALRSGGFPAAD